MPTLKPKKVYKQCPDRSCHDKFKCVYVANSDGTFRCAYPDAYKVFKKSHAHKCWTERKMKQQFLQQKRSGHLSREMICQMARNVGLTDENDIRKLDDACAHFTATPEWRPNRTVIREQIASRMQRSSFRFSDRNFSILEFRLDRILHLLWLVDSFYFKGSFFPWLKQKGFQMMVTLVAENTPDYAFVNIDDKNRKMLHFNFNIVPWTDRAGAAFYYGLQPRNKLEALILTIEHEMTHLLLIVGCPQRETFAHNNVFVKVNQNKFGHGRDAFVDFSRNRREGIVRQNRRGPIKRGTRKRRRSTTKF
jgi:hypothetical protein